MMAQINIVNKYLTTKSKIQLKIVRTTNTDQVSESEYCKQAEIGTHSPSGEHRWDNPYKRWVKRKIILSDEEEKQTLSF